MTVDAQRACDEMDAMKPPFRLERGGDTRAAAQTRDPVRQPCEPFSGILLGDLKDLMKPWELQSRGVGLVVSLCEERLQEPECNWINRDLSQRGIEHLTMPTDKVSSVTHIMRDYFHLEQDIKSYLGKGNGVFIHCDTGINRAPTIVIAYFVFCEDWDLVRAFEHVKSKRGEILTDTQFRRRLAQVWSDGKAEQPNDDRAR